MQKEEKKEILQDLLIVLLLVSASVNLLSGLQGFLIKGGETADDFTMRYRESKYVLAGINPFDVIFGLQKETSIGSLWDVAGYTPWGMVYGIVINFTFLPEKYARYLFFVFYLCFMAFTVYLVYRVVRKHYSIKASCLIALAAFNIPGWFTGLSWLNFGALFGAAIFAAVLLLDTHPVLAGVLFGMAATKPQLALPFYLGLVLKKKYKTLIPAIVLPLCAWVVAAVLTATGLFEMLFQYSSIIRQIGGQMGNWTSSLTVYFDDVDFASGGMSLFAMLSCIMLAIYIWHVMIKNGVDDPLSFFSVPAVLSGMWTYSQTHDRTVWVIVLVALALNMKNVWERDGKMLVLIYASFFIDTIRAGRLLSYLTAAGTTPSLVLDLLKYIVWIWCLLILAKGNITYRNR